MGAKGSGRRMNPRLLELEHLVGVEPDAVIATRAGVSAGAVAYYRRNLARKKPKAPTNVLEAAKVDLVTRNDSKIAPYLHLIGTMPDKELAQLAGVSRQAVGKMRTRFGVCRFGSTTGET